MTKMLRAILISPLDRTISELYIMPGLEGLYYTLGKADSAFSGMVEHVQAGRKTGLWIDEEGVLSEGRPVFKLGPQYFAGPALLLGDDGEGDSCDCPVPLPIAQMAVEWTSLETTGDFGPSREYTTEHPIFGKIPVIEGGQPIYRERA